MSAALKERLFNARARSSDSRLSTASPQTRKGQEGSTKATQHCNHSPWLLRRTSVQVSSESSEPHCIGDSVKTAHTQTCVDQDKRGLRTRLAKLSGNPGSGNSDTGHTALQFEVYQGHEAGNFGTTVTIQAVQPSQDKCRDRHEMKGLEQAASVKRWPGGGKPSEAWGKLMKDPELWDATGDTLVYFGYQQPQPSFRLRSSVLTEFGSEALTSELQDGQRRNNSAFLSHLRPANTIDMLTESEVRYEMQLSAPTGGSRLDILRHHITTRNFIALLLRKALVGLTFYQALTDLHERIQAYLPTNPNCALILIRYLIETQLHNVCNIPANAAGLTAWSEHQEVCWLEGWREGFVHSSGMYTRIQGLPEFCDISHTSRALLQRAHLERQVRIKDVERRLSKFDFEDMWPADFKTVRTTYVSMDRFKRFLYLFYAKANKMIWPPKETMDDNGCWLTRPIVDRMRSDFDALYDMLVDRDIYWTESKDLESCNRVLIYSKGPESKIGHGFDHSLAQVFDRFDTTNSYSHISRPYPLFPAPIFSLRSTKAQPSHSNADNKTLTARIAHAYSEASNALRVGARTTSNTLVESFIRFEKTDELKDVEPSDARKGRWIIIYCVLQLLSRVSLDIPGLYFAENVPYFLNPRLENTPPWSLEYDDG